MIHIGRPITIAVILLLKRHREQLLCLPIMGMVVIMLIWQTWQRLKLNKFLIYSKYSPKKNSKRKSIMWWLGLNTQENVSLIHNPLKSKLWGQTWTIPLMIHWPNQIGCYKGIRLISSIIGRIWHNSQIKPIYQLRKVWNPNWN